MFQLKHQGAFYECILSALYIEETFEKLEEVLEKHEGVFLFREDEFSRLKKHLSANFIRREILKRVCKQPSQVSPVYKSLMYNAQV